jgi:hypothetical protein
MVSTRHLLGSTTSVLNQFQPISELQETQHPGNAAFNLAFREIQLVCDIAVTQTSTHQTIDRKENAQSLPKIAHGAPTLSRDQVAVMENDLALGKRNFCRAFNPMPPTIKTLPVRDSDTTTSAS